MARIPKLDSIRRLSIALALAGLVLYPGLRPSPVTSASVLRTSDCLTPADGLVGWWPGDAQAQDIQGRNRGSLEQGAAVAPGWVGQAFQFAGSGQQLTLPDGLIYIHTNITFEAWFQTTGHGVILGYQDVPYPRRPGYYYQPALYVGTDGKLRGEFWITLESPITTPGPVNDGQWHHVALAAATTEQWLYLDGALVGQLAGTLNGADQRYNQIGNGYTGVWPGGTGGWDSFDGLIDEPSLYDRALSTGEVQAIFEAGSAGKCRQLSVSSISPFYRPFGAAYLVGTSVSLQAPATQAHILLQVSEPDGHQTGYWLTTNRNGEASQSFLTQATGTYTFTVRSVLHLGRPYDPAQNVETSDSVTIP